MSKFNPKWKIIQEISVHPEVSQHLMWFWQHDMASCNPVSTPDLAGLRSRSAFQVSDIQNETVRLVDR